LYRPVAVPNGKQIIRTAPDRWWALVPEVAAGRLCLQEIRHERSVFSDYQVTASLPVAAWDARAAQSAMLADQAGRWHFATSNGEEVIYQRHAREQVQDCLARLAPLPSAEQAWTLPGADLGDMVLLDGNAPCLACVQRGGEEAAIVLALPLQGAEQYELARGRGFRPPAVHRESGRLLLTWADDGARVWFQEADWRRLGETPDPPQEIAGPGRRPSIISDGRRLFVAYEEYWNETVALVRQGGTWQRFSLTAQEPRFTVDVTHSAHLSLDAHGVVWLFFSDANRCFTYFTRWLGSEWGQICDARGLFERAPYYDTNLLSADYFSVEKHPPGGDLALLMTNAATGQSALDTVPVVVPEARAGSRVLFLDMLEVREMDNLERALVPATKDAANPVFSPSEDREAFDCDRVFNHGAVTYEQGRFRMWYSGMRPYPESVPWWHWLDAGYAESRDGRRWERVNLGLREWHGSRENNLLPKLAIAPNVFIDETDPDPARRYKMLDFLNSGLQQEAAQRGEYVLDSDYFPGFLYTSPDGIHWTREALRVEFPGGAPLSLVPMCLFRDDQEPDPARRWKAYGFTSVTYRRRAGACAYSPDALHWTAHPRNPVLEPRTSRQPIIPAGQRSQIHDTIVWQQAGLYLCLFQDQRGLEALPLELAVSRDGEHFTYFAPGEAFLPLGAPGEWDEREPCPSVPLRVGDEMWFYYCGSTLPPGGTDLDYRTCAGLARARLDSYTCLRPREESGALTTVPFQVAEPVRVVVNATCDEPNPLRVEVLTAEGQAVAGYGRQECLPVTADGLYLPVAWQRSSTIAPTAAFSLRFHLEGPQTRLYSFGFESP
jgi:hypothetical protein